MGAWSSSGGRRDEGQWCAWTLLTAPEAPAPAETSGSTFNSGCFLHKQVSPLAPDTLRSEGSCFQRDGQKRCPLKPRALDQDALFQAPGPARPPGGRLGGPSWEETLPSSRACGSESGVSTLSPSIRCISLPGREEDREPRPQLSHPQLGGRWEGARWGGLHHLQGSPAETPVSQQGRWTGVAEMSSPQPRKREQRETARCPAPLGLSSADGRGSSGVTPNLPVTFALDSEGRWVSKISPSTCQGRWAAPSSEIKAGTQTPP